MLFLARRMHTLFRTWYFRPDLIENVLLQAGHVRAAACAALSLTATDRRWAKAAATPPGSGSQSSSSSHDTSTRISSSSSLLEEEAAVAPPAPPRALPSLPSKGWGVLVACRELAGGCGCRVDLP